MAPTIPTTEPKVLRAGETWAWDITLVDFPPSDGWTLTYRLVGPSKLTITADVSGEVYEVRAGPTDTQGLEPGAYSFAAQVSKGEDETLEVYDAGRSGTVRVLENLATAGASVSHAAAMLDLVETALQAHMTGNMAGVQRMNINGRSVDRYSLEELEGLRAKYASEVAREQAAAAGRSPFTSVAAVMRAPS